MKKKIILFVVVILTLLMSCKVENNLLHSAKNWKAVTDTLGSTFSPKEIEIKNDAISVDFTLKKKEGDEIVFIELVCALNFNLKEYSTMKITYTCDTPLLIKLSQKDFGGDGNKTYSHYQYRVPAAADYSEIELNFSDFEQPNWTPEKSKSIPLKLENVNDIYLTPDVSSEAGGKSKLSVKSIVLN